METKPEAPIAKSEMSSTEAAEFLHVTRRSVARLPRKGNSHHKKKVISFSSKGVMWKILLSSAE